jgi:ribonuclease HI
MQLSLSQKKAGIKAIKTLKELNDGSFKDTDRLCDIEELFLNAGTPPTPSTDTNEFTLPIKFIDSYDFFCFSDGACRGNPGPGAWGSVIQNRDGEVIFQDHGVENPSTNNRMEMTGALRCLEFLKKNGHLGKRVIVISDSKYVVDGMNQWVAGWKRRGWKKADKKAPENLDIWMSLDELRLEFAEVGFSWVKGHAGHPQNEKCDQLANEALDNAGL